MAKMKGKNKSVKADKPRGRPPLQFVPVEEPKFKVYTLDEVEKFLEDNFLEVDPLVIFNAVKDFEAIIEFNETTPEDLVGQAGEHTAELVIRLKFIED